jgi:hypothetical protein
MLRINQIVDVIILECRLCGYCIVRIKANPECTGLMLVYGRVVYPGLSVKAIILRMNSNFIDLKMIDYN